jgi:hypothetical protein
MNSKYHLFFHPILLLISLLFHLGCQEVNRNENPHRDTASEHAISADSGLAAGTGWHHAAFVIDSSNDLQKLLVDGVVVASEAFSDDLVYDATRNYTDIGMHVRHDRYELVGSVDEVRVSATARTEAWLRFCYENQRPDGQTLVAFP